MFKRSLAVASIFLSVLLGSFSAQAMYIDKAIVDFLPDEVPRQDVKVINDTDENLYVKVDVLEVLNPGTEKEERKPVTNPDDIKLLVTPAKMVVSPNGTKLLRLVNLDESLTEEKVYRINVTPILPPMQNPAESKVRVVVAYQVLVLVAPNKPKFELQAQRQGKMLTLKNIGNSYVLISEGRQCPKDKKSDADCHTLEAKRLYAGNEYALELPYQTPVELTLKGVSGNAKQMIE